MAALKLLQPTHRQTGWGGGSDRDRAVWYFNRTLMASAGLNDCANRCEPSTSLMGGRGSATARGAWCPLSIFHQVQCQCFNCCFYFKHVRRAIHFCCLNFDVKCWVSYYQTCLHVPNITIPSRPLQAYVKRYGHLTLDTVWCRHDTIVKREVMQQQVSRDHRHRYEFLFQKTGLRRAKRGVLLEVNVSIIDVIVKFTEAKGLQNLFLMGIFFAAV